MAAPFVLRTLGVPQLATATGEVVRFRTRKHFALAIRLAVEPGRPLTRDHLFELLWSDAPDHRGRHSLAQAITVLRTKLGREALSIHKATIALVPGVVDADVLHLDDCDTAISGGFLEGFEIPHVRPFEDWRDAWHAGLLPKLRDCLVRQMNAGRRVGDFEKVERHANVLRQLEPLSEDAVRGIMEARAWAGDRTSALKAFTAFETKLSTELKAKPNGELIRIASLLREGRRSPYRQPSRPLPDAGEKRFEPERLVGREHEFGHLYDGWTNVQRRQPIVTILTGDAGTGKTTLTNAFASICQMEGAVVARAQAYDAERDLPFAVLGELVRQLTIQRAIGAADPDCLSELARVCGDVITAFPGVPKPAESVAEITPVRLADAFLKTITAASEEAPLLLVVDDLHAADNASATVLHCVFRKMRSIRVGAVLTSRPIDQARSGAAQAIVEDNAMIGTHKVELETLSQEVSEQLLRTLVREREQSLPEAVASSILAASRGNPLAIELLVLEWLEHRDRSLIADLDRLNTLPAAAIGIPQAIRRVFQQQTTRLAQAARATLDLASVLGRRVSDLDLYSIINLEPMSAASTLSELSRLGLLREVQGVLEFRNELLRAQAYYAVAPLARQELHIQVARALKERGQSCDQTYDAEIAWHLMRASEWELAVPHAVRGAQNAIQAGAPREAEQLLEVLIHRNVSAESCRAIELTLCRALLDQSRAQQALPRLERLLAVEQELSSEQVADAIQLLSTAEYLSNRETGGRHFIAAQKALLAARETRDSDRIVKALFEYARSGAESGDESRVRSAFEELRDLVPSLARTQNQAFGQYALAYCEYFLFEVESASARLEFAIELLESQHNDVLMQLAYTGLGICHYTLCSPRPSVDAYEKALAIANGLADDSRASVITGNLAAVMLLTGDYAEAIRWGKESVERGERALNQPMLRNAYGNLTEALLLSGRIDDALKAREAGAAWVQKERSWHARLVYGAEDACHLLMLGDFDGALNTAEKLERLVAGRERAVPPISSYEMLMTIRMCETQGRDAALHMATSISAKYRGRVPLALLTALCVEGWLRQLANHPIPDTFRHEVGMLLEKVPGRRDLYESLRILDWFRTDRAIAAAASTRYTEAGVRPERYRATRSVGGAS